MTFFLPLAGALWLGMLASVSPCPLATNIAALSYLLQSGGNSKKIAWNSFAYVLGRTLVTVLLGVLVLRGLFAVPGLSGALQNYMNRFVGPLLMLTSAFVLELLPLGPSGVLAEIREELFSWAPSLAWPSVPFPQPFSSAP
jgi:cytochrome c biogenesis protein CcdA